MCAHIMRFTSLGLRSRCLMPQHVPLAFTKLTKCLLGHFFCPHPAGLIAKYCNIFAYFWTYDIFQQKLMVRERSLKNHWSNLRFKWKWKKVMAGMKLHVTAANSPANIFMRKFYVTPVHGWKKGKYANYSPWTPSVCRCQPSFLCSLTFT